MTSSPGVARTRRESARSERARAQCRSTSAGRPTGRDAVVDVEQIENTADESSEQQSSQEQSTPRDDAATISNALSTAGISGPQEWANRKLSAGHSIEQILGAISRAGERRAEHVHYVDAILRDSLPPGEKASDDHQFDTSSSTLTPSSTSNHRSAGSSALRSPLPAAQRCTAPPLRAPARARASQQRVSRPQRPRAPHRSDRDARSWS